MFVRWLGGVRWVHVLHWASLVGIILLMASPVLLYPMGRDQGMYANIARTILAGGVPFVDMWDIKPPPIYYLYALALTLFGTTTAAIRALDLLMIPVGMVAIYGVGRRLGRTQDGDYGHWLGLWSVLMMGAFYFNEQFASLSQNDSLIGVLLIWAIFFTQSALLAVRGSRGEWVNALLVGALGGVILWFKHYNAFFLLAMVAQVIMTRRALPIKASSGFVVGGLLTGGGLLVFFWAQGMVDEMFIVAEGTAAYNAQGYDFGAFIGNMGNYLYFRWLHWGFLLVCVALWLPMRWLGGRRGDGWGLIWGMIGAGLAFAFIQAKGFDTHWMPMLPALALLGADTLVRLMLAMRRRWGRIVGRVAVMAGLVIPLGILADSTWRPALPYITGQIDTPTYYSQFQANDLKPEQSWQVVNYLEQHVAPGDTLFIWGFRPEVYYMGGWRPATRFQAHFPLVAPWYPQAWRDENVAILWAAMPPYALVLEDDYMPWVTDRHEDSHQLLQEYTELNNWYIANYERVGKIGDFILWRRR